jgi:hypothetical protein
MKRFCNYKSIPLLVLLGSLVALALRFWTRSGGPNEAGLYPRHPLAWTLLLIVTAAVAVFCLLANRKLKTPGSYRDNYPRSGLAALCAVPAALSFLVSGYSQLKNSVGYALPGTTVVDTVTGILALVAGLALLLSAVYRFMGQKPFFLINGLVCLYLAVRLFNCCRLWSNEPKMDIVLFPFLASTALMLSAYYRVCFDVDLGNRPVSAFWSLMSAYLCIVAMLSFEQPWVYGLCALWQIADLCSLRPLQAEPAVPETGESEPAQEPEAPEAEE